MKQKFLLLYLVSMLFATAFADNVTSAFYGVNFGAPSAILENKMKENEIEPIPVGIDIFAKKLLLEGEIYQTVGFYFSPLDGGLYRVVGSNKFEDKEEANNFYSDALAKFREKYPKFQSFGKSGNIEKRIIYLDSENAVSLELLSTKKDGKKIYFTRITLWNILSSTRIEESKK